MSLAVGTSLPVSFKEAKAARMPWTAPNALIRGKTTKALDSFLLMISNIQLKHTSDFHPHGFGVSDSKVRGTATMNNV